MTITDNDKAWSELKNHIEEFINRVDSLETTDFNNLFGLTELEGDKLGKLILAANDRATGEFIADALLLKCLMSWCDINR